MDQKKYLKIKDYVQDNEFWKEEFTGYPQFCFSFMHAYVDVKKILGIGFDVCIIMLDKDYFYEVTPLKNKAPIREILFKKYIEDESFVTKQMVDWFVDRDNFYKIFDKIEDDSFSKLSIIELKKLYNSYVKGFREMISFSILVESFDNLEHEGFPEYFTNKYNISVKESSELISYMVFPSEMSFVNEEEMDFRRLCLDTTEENIQKHLKKYFWFSAGFAISEPYSRKELMDRINFEKNEFSDKEIENKIINSKMVYNKADEFKKELIKRYKLEKDDIKKFKLLEIFTIYQDNRKKMFLTCNFYLSVILKNIAQKYNLNPVVLAYYTIDEVNHLLDLGARTIVESRMDKSVFIRFFDNEYVMDYEQSKQIIDIVLSKHKHSVLKGFVASAPVEEIEGEVQIIFSVKNAVFEKGKILVTSMTRPEFFPLMKKAKAIITNEGGLTSHAAIVSRELCIPCVIGTKNATNILKDGDIVHINLKTGEIKVIK